jgi:uncharacterized protein (DUF2062 family)
MVVQVDATPSPLILTAALNLSRLKQLWTSGILSCLCCSVLCLIVKIMVAKVGRIALEGEDICCFEAARDQDRANAHTSNLCLEIA